MTDVVLILTTVPVGEEGETIARTLVDERLAACVNILPPMTSFYRWKNVVERSEERQVVIKTIRSLVPTVRDRLHVLHSYQLPEFMVLPASGGSDAYLGWITENVR